MTADVLELLRRRSHDLVDVDSAAIASAVVALGEEHDDPDELIRMGVHLARCGAPRIDEAVVTHVQDCSGIEPIATVLFGYWQAFEGGPSPAAASALLESWRVCDSFSTLASIVPFALSRAVQRLEPSLQVSAEIRSLLQRIVFQRPEWTEALSVGPPPKL